MSYTELIQRLQTLSAAQQAMVFDFVEFLASRQAAAGPDSTATPTTATKHQPKPMWLDEPLRVPAFTPLSREEANAR